MSGEEEAPHEDEQAAGTDEEVGEEVGAQEPREMHTLVVDG